ncbi:NADPH:quinone oxidoreductase family protein [Tepidamorphus sp. 3E244]|uniref:NADPH:quinone oxidoreductase family protein n=1 Tax=Tepidamorphus sp. 3E244 TaxID=3385498 RepID=UPI0038FC0E8F
MKAVLCKQFGPPETLVVEEVASPEPGPGEIRVDVKACALNFFDTLIIENKYQYKPEPPFSPSAELAGVVSACGEGVSRFKEGDRVVAYTGWGAAREQVVLDENRAVALPDNLAFEAAAGLLVTYGTTIHGLKDRGRLQPGETLAVLGASGGTGIAAVEIGKLMGAKVIACASSQEKLDFCRKHGADETIDYSSQNLKDRLKELTGGAGVDVVYDPVGGDYSEQALRAVAWKGRFLVIGFAAGQIPKIPLNLALLKGLDICGVFWGHFFDIQPEDARANHEQLVAWAAEGKLTVPVDRTFPMDEAIEALQVIARREARGKIILKM